jgi:hypothetical protein
MQVTLILAIVAAVLMAGGTALLGLPGGVYFYMADPPVALLMGVPIGESVKGPATWAAALVMTNAVPPAIPISYFLADRLWPKLGGWWKALITFATTYVWAVVFLYAAIHWL